MSNVTHLLEVEAVSKHFGAVKAVDAVTWSLKPGEIGGVVGPNGSGKTTLFNCLSGYYSLSAGMIRWKGKDIRRTGMRARSSLGLVRTFQTAEVFGSLSVRENVGLAAHRGRRGGGGGVPRSVDELLELTGIEDVAERRAGALSYGNKRLLGIALALGTAPEALLLDEPTSGLNEAESLEVQSRLRRLRDTGIAIGIIDHHMEFLLPLVDSVLVLQSGAMLWQGDPGDFAGADEVIEAYLGRTATASTVSGSEGD
jgi:ABC-type branched-subunit amino acid transport system ATPase component